MKRGVYLYLTAENYEELKKRGVNVSREVDKYLAQRVRALRKAELAHSGRGKSR